MLRMAGYSRVSSTSFLYAAPISRISAPLSAFPSRLSPWVSRSTTCCSIAELISPARSIKRALKSCCFAFQVRYQQRRLEQSFRWNRRLRPRPPLFKLRVVDLASLPTPLRAKIEMIATARLAIIPSLVMNLRDAAESLRCSFFRFVNRG